MAPPVLDLLIIGAGPVGLCVAVGALARGAKNVLVVDQARAFRKIGQPLDLLPNAMRTLTAISPTIRKNMEPFICEPPPGHVRETCRSFKGDIVSSTRLSEFGELAVLVWWELQQVLLDSLPDRSVVVVNHQLVDIVHEPDTGLACAEFVRGKRRQNGFKNWEELDEADDQNGDTDISSLASDWFFPVDECSTSPGQRVRCRAKVVVGADGINSTVRRCVYRDTFPNGEALADPLYCGWTRVLARGYPEDVEADEAAVEEQYTAKSQLVMLTREAENVTPYSMRILIIHPQPPTRAPYRWQFSFFFTLDKDTSENTSPRQLTEIAKDVARSAGLSEAALRVSSKIWDETPDDQIKIRRYYNVPTTHPIPYDSIPKTPHREYPTGFRRPWHSGRVVLAGDSAHGLPNFMAQGACLGIEDAHELVRQLETCGLWADDAGVDPSEQRLSEAFEAFRLARLERVTLVQRWTTNWSSEYDEEKSTKIRDYLYRFDPAAEYHERVRWDGEATGDSDEAIAQELRDDAKAS